MNARAAITVVFSLFCISILSVEAEVKNAPDQSKDTAATSNLTQLKKPVYDEITNLIRTYYPNAKITETSGKLHFEFKVASHMSVSSNRPELAPNVGGILGDVEIKPGVSKVTAKSVNEYYYQTDVMAPYCANHDCYLSVKVSYPPDTTSDFVDKFKSVVKDFDTLLPAPAQTAAVQKPEVKDTASAATALAAPQTAPAQDASVSTKPIAAAVSLPATTAQPTAAVKPPASARKLFFWKARKGPDLVYLLGTIHTAPPSLYPLPKEIERAFNESKCLVVEVDISKRKVDPAKVHQLVETSGKYTPPDKLSKHLSPSTKHVFEAYLNWAGESWAIYEPYKPWYVRELVSASVPRRGDISKLRKGLGIDLHFLGKAIATKKMVEEFETVDFQLALDSKLAPEVQDKLLQVSLLEMKDTDAFLASIFDAWKQGDVDKMELTAAHMSVDNPELAPFTKALLDNRNVGMAAKIEPFLKTKGSPLFVAVGSAHMVGETGLVNLLKKKGFELEQVVSVPDQAASSR